jgi:hypothetical protein
VVSTSGDQVAFKDMSQESYPLFGGHSEIDRHLYIQTAGSELLQGNNALSVQFRSDAEIRTGLDEIISYLRWEYWNGTSWVDVESHGAITGQKKEANRIFLQGPIDIAPTAVEGQEGFWIRASLVRKPESQRP